MSIHPVELTVGDETYAGRSNVRDGDAEEGVVVVPGAGHGPFGDIFDVVAYELAGTGRRVLRYESWESHEQLKRKTLAELHAELDAAVEWLLSNGCSTVHVLAKSFGGGVALTHVPDAVESLILWAPAVEFPVDSADANDPDETVEESGSIRVGIASLDRVDVPVRILCGTDDRGVSLDDCRRIADAVADGDVFEIPGENHSFNENRTEVVDRTLACLAKR